MEDEKVMHQRPSRWQFLAGSTFLLCLLLVGTVSTLIYVQLSSGVCVSRAQRSGSADIQETIHLVGTDKMPLGDETISYNKEESVAVYVGAGGSFNLQDYGKGLHITKLETGKCVIMVTDSTSITSRGMEDFLQRRDGHNVNMTIDYDANYQVIPGMIEDTSFISTRADEHCTEGYQWMVEHPKPQTGLPGQPDNGDGAVVSGEDHVIVKRGQPGASHHCPCHCHGDHCHCHCCSCGGGGGSPGQPGAAGQPGQP